MDGYSFGYGLAGIVFGGDGNVIIARVCFVDLFVVGRSFFGKMSDDLWLDVYLTMGGYQFTFGWNGANYLEIAGIIA